MSRNIELRSLLDKYEKEGIINNKLNERNKNVDDFKNNIQNNISEDADLNDSHLTNERGSKLIESKIIFHKYWVKQMYLAHKILIPILIFIVLFMLFFKMANL
jgi:hypothetical protein